MLSLDLPLYLALIQRISRFHAWLSICAEGGLGHVLPEVVSGKTNKVTAANRVSPSPGSVAVNPRTDTIFMTSYPSHKVAVISGRTSTVTTTIRAGSGLGEIAVNPKTGKAYVTGR